MKFSALKKRTKMFAFKVSELVKTLPPGRMSTMIGRQLLRSATAVDVNHRAMLHSGSDAAFMLLITIVVEQIDETIYWIEFLKDERISDEQRIAALLEEASALKELFELFAKWARKESRKVEKKKRLDQRRKSEAALGRIGGDYINCEIGLN